MSDSIPPSYPPPPTGALPPTAGGYPATLTFDPPDKIARWRVIGNIVLAIPHFIVLYVFSIVASVLAFVAWLLGVFTGKIPEGILGILAAYLRYSTRVVTYSLFLKEEYPPFSFATAFADPGDDPRLRVDFAPQVEGRSRASIFFRLLLLIPHFIALFFVGIAFYVVVVIGWFAVLITGTWPAGLRDFVIGFQRWGTRLNASYYLLTDEYPPFGFRP